MNSYYDLGSHSRIIATHSPASQIWFDRGLNWIFGFSLEQASRCFRKAIETDPQCAMLYWGLAYSSGCYYNQPWSKMEKGELREKLSIAYDASQRAVELSAGVSNTESALIRALAARYQSRIPIETPGFNLWDDEYADAMGKVYQANPNDNDICALFAESLMCRTPWALWNLQSGEPADGASTSEAILVLEDAMSRLKNDGAPPHPGILHMYIHVMEMSPFPERALKAADALRDLVPDLGHLRHMPSHIDVRVGNYHDAVIANDKAIAVDRKYLAEEGAINLYTLSRIHNFHFKIYAALFLGQYHSALDSAIELIDTTPEELLRVESPAMADWMEAYVGMKAHVFIRFGKWSEIIAEPLPIDEKLYCMTTAIWHYAKTIAYAATGDVKSAESQRDLFNLASRKVLKTRFLFNNSCIDLLAIAKQMLNGEIEYRKTNYDQAFAHLRAAVRLDDNLKYDEPWGWMQPARHALGALLLEQNHIEEATSVYRADLGLDDTLVSTSQHPDNLWSLHGYVECLLKTGNIEDAKTMKKRLDLAGARADVTVNASCYCRSTS
jgi:tetratricopeptide (TPR) repeat protein